MHVNQKNEIMRHLAKVVPHFEEYLQYKLQEELKALVVLPTDRVQVSQGRAQLLQELLAELRAASGNSANRTAKP